MCYCIVLFLFQVEAVCVVLGVYCGGWVLGRAPNEGYPKVPEDFTITRAFSWLKVPTVSRG